MCAKTPATRPSNAHRKRSSEGAATRSVDRRAVGEWSVSGGWPLRSGGRVVVALSRASHAPGSARCGVWVRHRLDAWRAGGAAVGENGWVR